MLWRWQLSAAAGNVAEWWNYSWEKVWNWNLLTASGFIGNRTLKEKSLGNHRARLVIRQHIAEMLKRFQWNFSCAGGFLRLTRPKKLLNEYNKERKCIVFAYLWSYRTQYREKNEKEWKKKKTFFVSRYPPWWTHTKTSAGKEHVAGNVIKQ